MKHSIEMLVLQSLEKKIDVLLAKQTYLEITNHTLMTGVHQIIALLSDLKTDSRAQKKT